MVVFSTKGRVGFAVDWGGSAVDWGGSAVDWGGSAVDWGGSAAKLVLGKRAARMAVW